MTNDQNFYLDRRTVATVVEPPVLRIPIADGWDFEERALPWRYAVCDLCDGFGEHVNPSIDAGGLTARDFADDPDFAAEYRRGVYNVPCHACEGRRVIPVVDEAACAASDLAAYREQQREDAEQRAEEARQRAYGY